jgi:hypothetical protein
MTGDDILKLAGDLFARERSPSEALCRNVIGRAYYGAFHVALGFLADLGLPKPVGHGEPAQWLIGSGERNAANAGRILQSLGEARRHADYELTQKRAIDESRDLTFVKNQVESANDVKVLLSACGVEPVRSRVIAGIQQIYQKTARRGTP